MKQEFSVHWKGSSQVRKQRKYVHNAPLHARNRFLNARLSKELHTKYGKRSMTVRKGDEVLIMRGSFAQKKGKIASVDLSRSRVVLEGITRSKKDGSKASVFFRTPALRIISLGTEDKKRIRQNKPLHSKEVNHAPNKG
ncbi:MAG: 50S ribosomal protein L24 [Nanoarchaeota archaeon]